MGMVIFIYGTLKRGQKRAAVLEGQQFLGEVVTAPFYRLFDTGSYPALVECSGGVETDASGGPVEGELWRVDDACLAELDRIECVPDLYRRGPVAIAEVVGADADSHFEASEQVETYFYQRSTEGLRDCGRCWP